MEVKDKIKNAFEPYKIHLIYGESDFEIFLFLLFLLLDKIDYSHRSGLITEHSPESIINGLIFLGYDPVDLLKKEKLITLNFQPFVGEKIISFNSYNRIVYEIKNLMGKVFPEKIGVHTVFPFLSTASAEDILESLYFMKEALGRLNTTIFITYREKGEYYDISILNQLKKIAATIVNIKKDIDEVRYILFEKSGSEEVINKKILFSLKKGSGFVFAETKEASFKNARLAEGKHKILCYSGTEDKFNSVFEELKNFYSVRFVSDENSILASLLETEYDLIIICEADYQKLINLLKYLRKQKVFIPIIVISRKLKRVSDRAKLFLYSADEVIFDDLRVETLLVKIENLIEKSAITHTYYKEREYIKFQEWIKKELSKKENFVAGLNGIVLTVDAFRRIGDLIIKSGKIANEIHVLVGIKFSGNSPSFEEVGVRFGKIVRKNEDIITALADGTYLVLLNFLSSKNIDKVISKFKNEFNNTSFEVKYSVFPADGESIDTLVNNLLKKFKK